MMGWLCDLGFILRGGKSDCTAHNFYYSVLKVFNFRQKTSVRPHILLKNEKDSCDGLSFLFEGRLLNNAKKGR